MKRSPRVMTASLSNRIRAKPRVGRESDPAKNFGRALMKPNACAVLQRSRVHRASPAERPARRVGSNAPRVQSTSPRDTSATSSPPRFDSRPLAGDRPRPRTSVHLHSTHLHGRPAGNNASVSSRADHARYERPGHNGPEAAHRERAIDRQPDGAIRAARRASWTRARASSSRRRSRPSPFRADTGTIGAPSRNESLDQLAHLEPAQIRACQRRRGPLSSARPGRPAPATACRSRSARASAASPTRLRRSRASRRRCRRRRPACCARTARVRARRRTRS